MARLIIANLDCEVSWLDAARPGAATALSAAARARAADAGAELAVLSRPGDRLWLLDAPSAAARVAAEARGVTLEHGPLDEVAPADAVMAWGETAAAAARRPPAPIDLVPTAGLAEGLWAVTPSTPAIAARANDRRFGMAIAEGLGALPPGTRPLDSIAALERHLAAGGAAAGAGAFVLKAPWSAAGRDRLIHRGTLDAAGAARAERLLARFGELCFEPWLERVDDLGQGGVVDGGNVVLWPAHRTEVDRHGVFRAARIESDSGWLAGDDRDALERTAEAAGHALARLGYGGPFAIDAFHHRRPDGTVALHPMCELNARLTFGLVARVAADRARAG